MEEQKYTLENIADLLVKNAYNRKSVSIMFEGIPLFNTIYVNNIFRNHEDLEKTKMQIFQTYNNLKSLKEYMIQNGQSVNQRTTISFNKNAEGLVYIQSALNDTVYDVAFKYMCIKMQGMNCPIFYQGKQLPSTFKTAQELINYCSNNNDYIKPEKINLEANIKKLKDLSISEVMDIYNQCKILSTNSQTVFEINADDLKRTIVISTSDFKLKIRKIYEISYTDPHNFDNNIKDDLINKIINNDNILISFNKKEQKDKIAFKVEYESGDELHIIGYNKEYIDALQKKINDINQQLIANEQLAKTCNITKLINQESNSKGFVETLLMGGLLVFLLVIAIILVLAMINK